MALDFAGDDDYINCGSGATIDDIFNGGGSVAVWIKADTPTESAYNVIVAQRSAAGETAGYSLITGYSRIELYQDFVNASNYGLWQMTTAYTSTGRNHIVITYDNTNAANDPVMYLNGVSVAVTESTTPTGTVNPDTASNITFGAIHNASSPYDGQMEDCRLFTRIITAEEAAILAAGYRGPIGGEVLWLDLQLARGAFAGTLTQGTHLFNDLSGNGNDGDPYGGCTLVESDCPRYGVLQFFPFAWPNFQSYAGALTFTGAVVKKTAPAAITGAITFTGAVVAKAKKALAGAITFVGSLVRKAKKALAGAITFTGAATYFKLRKLIAKFRDYFLTANERWAKKTIVADTAGLLLLETSDYLLKEDGDKLIIETFSQHPLLHAYKRDYNLVAPHR